MSSRIISLLKALLFIVLGGFMAFLYFTTEGKTWHIVAILLSALLAFAYMRQALDRYHR